MCTWNWDNLEYIIIRYQLGFVTKPVLRRAVRTFRSRCQSPEFAQLACQLVHGAGYHAKTVDVVTLLGRDVPDQGDTRSIESRQGEAFDRQSPDIRRD